MIRRLLLLLALTLGLAFAATPAQAVPSNCTGKFVNPVTDVCWSCLFPLSVGGLKVWPGNRPNTRTRPRRSARAATRSRALGSLSASGSRRAWST